MVKIIVDSSSDLTAEEAKNYGIILLPIEITFGGQTYLDGVELLPRRFFEKLVESDEMPKTCMINEARFTDCFEKATADGSEAVAIVLSSRLSGTCACAERAAAKFGGRVQVVDSMNASAGEKILALYAARLLSQGLNAGGIKQKLEEKKKKIQVLALLGTLTYLRKGGRLSAAQAIAGEMLSIKPVIGVIEGEVKLIGKAMGSKKGGNLLSRLLEQTGGIDFSMPYFAMYSGLDDSLLRKYVVDSEAIWKGHMDEVPFHLIGSTIGTHIGPGAIGVAFFTK